MKNIIYTLAMVLIVNCTLDSNHCCSQWIQMSNGMGNNKAVHSYTAIDSNIFAGTYYNGVYLSTNNGNNWTQTTLNNKTIFSHSHFANNIFAGTDSNGVWHSTNKGTNWSQTTLNNISVFALTVIGNNIFAGANEGVFISDNNGSTWSHTTLYQPVNSLVANGYSIFAGSYNGVFHSTNNGSNWTLINLNNQSIYSLAAQGNSICAGTENYIYISTNNGTNWSHTFFNNLSVNSITISGNNIFAGSFYGGVYLSTNNGGNWFEKNQGFGNETFIASLFITNNYIFAGTYGKSAWRRSFAEIIGIQNISTEIPSSYLLEQNYPNPFNPRTVIRFQVAGNSDVVIKVYDVKGREVQTLVNERMNAGKYELDFDGSSLPSGVYFYRLTSGDFNETRKMSLIK